MLLSVLFFLLSIIPSALIIVWLMNRRKEDLQYKKSCKSAVVRGVVAILPILAVSGVLSILKNVLKITLFKNMTPLAFQAIHDFIVLAFAEELVKFVMLRLLLKKRFNDYSFADVTAFMVIIGTAFGLVEDIPYAVGASPGMMLIRGITMGHLGYGFIMGWFYGKRLYTDKKRYGVIAFVLPFFIHGLYDFSLSPELLEVNDNLSAIAVSLAVTDVILLVLTIRFFIRSRKKEYYNLPLTATGQLPEQADSGNQ